MQKSPTLVLASLFVLIASAHLAAQCSAPSQPGVFICSPTPNATVVYVPGIEFNSTPVSGSIYKFIIYDNDKQIGEGFPYQAGEILYDAAIRNGYHNIVINAWDTNGNLVQGKVKFNVIGDGYPLFCSEPASPGINFCVPANGSTQPSGIPVSATAKGYSPITAIQVYLDGKYQFSQQGYNYLSSSVAPQTPGQHSVTMVAYDSTGHRFAATKTVTNSYDWVNCPPKGNNPCSPGWNVITPLQSSFVGNSFLINAQILNNPLPISAIKVYLDSAQVAQSGGPTIYQTVNNAPSGTHILTLQAWDTAGHLYRVQQNVNINVAH